MDPLLVAHVDLGAHPGYYAGWGTLALLNAGIAQGKNRSGLNWFVPSLIMGTVATFFLAAIYDPLPNDA